jgi:hypothetical protein
MRHVCGLSKTYTGGKYYLIREKRLGGGSIMPSTGIKCSDAKFAGECLARG